MSSVENIPAPAAEPAGPAASLAYRTPEIYDVATGWRLDLEIEFLERIFTRHAVVVQSVLEPCCGTARLLRALAEQGYEVAGYDLSPAMTAFARERLRSVGGEVWLGEMSAFQPPRVFDAAINLVNSIGYLLEDEAVAGHLERMGGAVRPGGIYVAQFSYGGEPPERARFGPWGNRGGDLSTTLLWEVLREDEGARRSYQHCRITARRGKERHVIDEEHVLRYWTHEDVTRFLAESPFTLDAIYWDNFEEFPLEDYRVGEHGNLYHVLRRKD
ncbi:MAG TPA: methyltransferase domain-containing protein [Candidatus Binatia bacterium]|nr:methyltransferase domain-containing protein [Candidatus Binatia bacterium]